MKRPAKKRPSLERRRLQWMRRPSLAFRAQTPGPSTLRRVSLCALQREGLSVPEPLLALLASSSLRASVQAAYVHYCDNETIHGLEFLEAPCLSSTRASGEKPPFVVSDMASSLATKPIDFGKVDLLYGASVSLFPQGRRLRSSRRLQRVSRPAPASSAGAQKNLGTAGVTLVAFNRSILSQSRPRARAEAAPPEGLRARPSLSELGLRSQVLHAPGRALGAFLREDAGGKERRKHAPLFSTVRLGSHGRVPPQKRVARHLEPNRMHEERRSLRSLRRRKVRLFRASGRKIQASNSSSGSTCASRRFLKKRRKRTLSRLAGRA